MIKLQVEDYCHDCLAFEAAVNAEKKLYILTMRRLRLALQQ